MNWNRTKDGMVSEDGKWKITNSGPKGGKSYCLWELVEWSSSEGKHKDFIRLVRTGTLEECKK